MNYDYYYRNFAPSPGASFASLAITVLFVASMWRVFTKAGEAGWKSLIPFYNAYTYFRIGWETEKFWVVFAGFFGIGFLSGILGLMGGFGATLAGLATLAWGIYVLVITVKLQIRMAHRFGKTTAFGAVGLWLFPFVGLPMLAWGSADYNAARDTGDGVLHSDAEISGADPYGSDFWDRFTR